MRCHSSWVSLAGLRTELVTGPTSTNSACLSRLESKVGAATADPNIKSSLHFKSVTQSEGNFMNSIDTSIDFTGEYFVPGKSGDRIEADHFERYRFASQFAQGKRILDIACGVGYSSPILLEAGGATYQGVDIDEKLVAHATRVYGSDRANYSVGNICAYGSDESYDLITCFETIEHVEDYRSALANLYRLLKPSGLLLVSSPNRPITSPRARSLEDRPDNRFHTQEFVPMELLTILRQIGFVVTDDAPIYGQRQRLFHSNRLIRKVMRIMHGDPETTTSPVVTPISTKVPRYFIVLATKP